MSEALIALFVVSSIVASTKYFDAAYFIFKLPFMKPFMHKQEDAHEYFQRKLEYI